ncbi:hypothetical protein P7K49_008957, partial [Saguinus oedipus]
MALPPCMCKEGPRELLTDGVTQEDELRIKPAYDSTAQLDVLEGSSVNVAQTPLSA